MRRFGRYWTSSALVLILWLAIVHTLPSPSKNVFRRLTDGVHSTRCARCQSDAPQLKTRHRCVYADGRLYFLSLKGKRQPTFSSYHETALYGGYLSAYGVGENETDGWAISNDALGSAPWSWSHFHFDPIDKHENREDAFFVLKNTLFLLVYSRFENVTFRNLYAWQRPSWVDVPLDVDPRAQILDGNVRNGGLAWTVADKKDQNDSEQSERTLYLTATDGWGRVLVSKMEVLFDQSTDRRPISASIAYLIDDESSPVDSGGAIVALTHRLGRLYAFYGIQGCSFHWEKRRLIIVDLNSTLPSMEYLNVSSDSEAPPWAFNGPALVERHGSAWFMFGGSVAAGVTGTEFDNRIWIFSFNNLRWKKSKRISVPDQLNPYEMCSAVDSSEGTVYLADFRNIYKAPLEHIR